MSEHPRLLREDFKVTFTNYRCNAQAYFSLSNRGLPFWKNLKLFRSDFPLTQRSRAKETFRPFLPQPHWLWCMAGGEKQFLRVSSMFSLQSSLEESCVACPLAIDLPCSNLSSRLPQLPRHFACLAWSLTSKTKSFLAAPGYTKEVTVKSQQLQGTFACHM